MCFVERISDAIKALVDHLLDHPPPLQRLDRARGSGELVRERDAGQGLCVRNLA